MLTSCKIQILASRISCTLNFRKIFCVLFVLKNKFLTYKCNISELSRCTALTEVLIVSLGWSSDPLVEY